MKRKIISISTILDLDPVRAASNIIVALCNDGTVWSSRLGDYCEWMPQEDIPQPQTPVEYEQFIANTE